MLQQRQLSAHLFGRRPRCRGVRCTVLCQRPNRLCLHVKGPRVDLLQQRTNFGRCTYLHKLHSRHTHRTHICTEHISFGRTSILNVLFVLNVQLKRLSGMLDKNCPLFLRIFDKGPSVLMKKHTYSQLSEVSRSLQSLTRDLRWINPIQYTERICLGRRT